MLWAVTKKAVVGSHQDLTWIVWQQELKNDIGVNFERTKFENIQWIQLVLITSGQSVRHLWWKTPFTLVLPSISLYQLSSLIFLSPFIDSVTLALNDAVKNNFLLYFLSFFLNHTLWLFRPWNSVVWYES